MGRWTVHAIGIFVLAVTAGCETTDKSSRRVSLTRGTPFESDIPVPAGFKIIDHASEDRSTGVNRLYLRHRYQGKSDVHSLRRFYRAQMPMAQWTLVSDGNIKGIVLMRYEKANESCTIQINGKESVVTPVSEVQVVVAREERGQPPATKRKTP